MSDPCGMIRAMNGRRARQLRRTAQLLEAIYARRGDKLRPVRPWRRTYRRLKREAYAYRRAGRA